VGEATGGLKMILVAVGITDTGVGYKGGYMTATAEEGVALGMGGSALIRRRNSCGSAKPCSAEIASKMQYDPVVHENHPAPATRSDPRRPRTSRNSLTGWRIHGQQDFTMNAFTDSRRL
jgi:hypothetical protein